MQESKYSQICMTSAYTTIDGANSPYRAIVSIEKGDNTFIVPEYYMEKARADLDNTACSESRTSLVNDN